MDFGSLKEEVVRSLFYLAFAGFVGWLAQWYWLKLTPSLGGDLARARRRSALIFGLIVGSLFFAVLWVEGSYRFHSLTVRPDSITLHYRFPYRDVSLPKSELTSAESRIHITARDWGRLFAEMTVVGRHPRFQFVLKTSDRQVYRSAADRKEVIAASAQQVHQALADPGTL